MSEQTDFSRTPAERPATADSALWRAYWKAAGVPWRTEPEIDGERMQALAQRRAVTPSVGQGIYPFSGQQLCRADVEWLLATHEGQRGPVDWAVESQRSRVGLDLRGADLRGADLRGLPLARMRGGEPGGLEAQQEMATVHLEDAKLAGARLEGAVLWHAHLERADLASASLENARLTGIKLGGANLRKAQLQGADVRYADLQDADAREANLAGVRMQVAHCERARFGSAVLDVAVLDRAHFEGALMQVASLAGASYKGTY